MELDDYFNWKLAKISFILTVAITFVYVILVRGQYEGVFEYQVILLSLYSVYFAFLIFFGKLGGEHFSKRGFDVFFHLFFFGCGLFTLLLMSRITTVPAGDTLLHIVVFSPLTEELQRFFNILTIYYAIYWGFASVPRLAKFMRQHPTRFLIIEFIAAWMVSGSIYAFSHVRYDLGKIMGLFILSFAYTLIVFTTRTVIACVLYHALLNGTLFMMGTRFELALKSR